MSETKFRLRLVPLVVTILFGFGIPAVSGILTIIARHFIPFLPHVATSAEAVSAAATLPFLYVQHGVQLLLALLVIAAIRRFTPADYGLHLPRGKSYVVPALLIGALFGVLMTVVDYWPQIAAHAAPQFGYSLSTLNIVGWLVFQGVYVGPTEEIPFRALMVTYLAAAMPGKIQVGNFSMNVAGVIVALLFAVAHVGSFWTQSLPMAIGQQLYAFALGVFYAYWFEKSKSVLAPIVGHNTGDFVEQALFFAMAFAWR